MKRILQLALVLALCQGLTATATSVAAATSKHNLSTGGPAGTYRSTNVDEVCVFCHTPHGSRIVAGQGGLATNQLPLWNKNAPSTTNYGIYNSATMNATMSTAGFGGGDNASSSLCMSCHDGTIGVGTLYNPPNAAPNPSNENVLITGTANLGTGSTALNNDHPVNFSYASASADTELYPDTNANVAALLIGGTVQCASCHDVHDSQYTPFLRMSNSGSALCLQCHIK